MSEDNNINKEDKAVQGEEPKMSRADHHKHLDEKYPTKRGIKAHLAKIGFLFLASVLTDFKCVGRDNFPKNNPYVVAANHQCFADGVLIDSTYVSHH